MMHQEHAVGHFPSSTIIENHNERNAKDVEQVQKINAVFYQQRFFGIWLVLTHYTSDNKCQNVD
jgi:hypothetical protein